jgi:hypothetical protein
MFLFKFFDLRKAIFEVVENSNDLNQFEFELNLTRWHCSQALLVRARPPLLGAVPCARAVLDCARRPQASANRQPPHQAPLSPPISLFHVDATPDPASPSPATRHLDKSCHPLLRPLFALSPVRIPPRAQPSPPPALLTHVHSHRHRRHPTGNQGRRHRHYFPPSVSSTAPFIHLFQTPPHPPGSLPGAPARHRRRHRRSSRSPNCRHQSRLLSPHHRPAAHVSPRSHLVMLVATATMVLASPPPPHLVCRRARADRTTAAVRGRCDHAGERVGRASLVRPLGQAEGWKLGHSAAQHYAPGILIFHFLL